MGEEREREETWGEEREREEIWLYQPSPVYPVDWANWYR